MADEPKLIRVTRLDSVPLEKVEYTQEGFLIDTPIVTSVGIFEYHDANGEARRELRLPEHVFDEASLDTYEGKPVIITHDAGRISKDNVTGEIVGTILSKGYRDGDDVRAKIIIHDTEAVKRSEFRELSLGYDLVLDETPGEWNGEPYDVIQTEIVINHLAIVREARAGEQARLNIDSKGNENDLQEGVNVMAGKSTKAKQAMNADETKKSIAAFEARRKRRLDEAEDITKPITEDERSEVAEDVKNSPDNPPSDNPSVEERLELIKDRRDRRDADGDPDDPETAKGVIANQDEDIEQLLEIVEELQAKADLADSDKKDSDTEENEDDDGGDGEKPINADGIDAIVSERLKLGRIGDRLNLDGLETLKPIDAKKRIIKAIKPDLRLDGKGSHYVNTAFDITVQELDSRKDTSYQRRQMFNSDGRSADAYTGKSKSQQAKENMNNRLKNGGK